MLTAVLVAAQGVVDNQPLRADVATLTAIVSVFLPIVVALVTKSVANSGIKAVLLAALATVTALVSQAIETDGVFTIQALQAGLLSFTVAVASYFGLWRSTVVPAVQKHLPGGLG